MSRPRLRKDVLLKASFVRVKWELWQYFYMTGCAECCFNVSLHVWVAVLWHCGGCSKCL